MPFPLLEIYKLNFFHKVAQDLRYLLSHGYPLNSAIELVGNHYQLSKDKRMLLQRGVCSESEAKTRKNKKRGLFQLRGYPLGIDGHNVLITIESALKNKPLILSDDGFIRDISAVSKSYRPSHFTTDALNLIFELLKHHPPAKVDWYLDAPLSKSGQLAGLIRDLLRKYKFEGTAQAVSVPERRLTKYLGLVATSDSILIDVCSEVIDLAGEVIKSLPHHPKLARLL